MPKMENTFPALICIWEENKVSSLSQQQIDSIATQVAQILNSDSKPVPKESIQKTDLLQTQSPLGAGIFADIDSAVKAANIAFKQLNSMSLEKRHEIINSIRKFIYLIP